MVYSDKRSSFGKLSETDRSIPIHVRNLQILATELFKVTKYLAPTNFRDTFSKQSVQYNLRHPSESFVPNVKSTSHGREILSYLGSKIWDLTFKKAIEK